MIITTLGLNRVEILKGLYPLNLDISFDTEESHEITSIDIDKNLIYYNTYVTYECGCCSGVELNNDDLTWYLSYMSESEFEGLISNIQYNTNKLR